MILRFTLLEKAFFFVLGDPREGGVHLPDRKFTFYMDNHTYIRNIYPILKVSIF